MMDIVSKIEKVEFWMVTVAGEKIKFPTYRDAVNFKKDVNKRDKRELRKKLKDHYAHTVFEEEITRNNGVIV